MPFYAAFGADGACSVVAESPVPLGGDWVEVSHRADPSSIFLSPDNGVQVREVVEIDLPRKVYAADGIDGPSIGGALGLEFIGPEKSNTPAGALVRATGAHFSEPVFYRFDTLENLKAEASAKIDAAAGVERLQHITDQPGQAAVYAAKLAEAQAWPDGPQAYVHSAEEAAEIVTRAAECDAALAEIEARRLADKRAISAATTVLELWEAGYVE